MKDFMSTEMRMSGIELAKLQRVNDTADGIKDTAAQQPVECRVGETGADLTVSKNADPAHADI